MNVIALGGNGFLGSAVVDALVAAGHRVTVLNRGGVHWGWRAPAAVKLLVADRRMLKLGLDLGEGTVMYDAVVDFSAYRRRDVRRALHWLRGRFRHYLYISSDSVYEVCNPAPGDRPDGSREDDAVRPVDFGEATRLALSDSYGHHKLAAEEYLCRQAAKHGFTATALRLPDVLGPRDNTDRLLNYITWLLWAHTSRNRHTRVHAFYPRPLSFVFAHDVAAAVVCVLADLAVAPSWQVWNLASGAPITLHAWLAAMAGILGVDPAHTLAPGVGTHTFFPSVSRGPVDHRAALADLPAWRPRPFTESLRDTCAAYIQALLDGVPEAQAAVREVWPDLPGAADHCSPDQALAALRPALQAALRQFI